MGFLGDPNYARWPPIAENKEDGGGCAPWWQVAAPTRTDCASGRVLFFFRACISDVSG